VSWLERPSILSWISSLPAKHFPTAVQNMLWLHKAWGDTAGPPGAGCKLKHHSLELDPSFGGHVMVQQQLIRLRCLGWKGHQFCLGFAPCLQSFSQLLSKTQHEVTQHGVTQLGHQELVAH
jgi:hypothetical protein